MKLEIKVDKTDDITIVKLIGNMDSNTAPMAETEFNKMIAESVNKLIVNLDETVYVSSAGLRVFLATTKRMTAAGNVVKFCSPNEVVQEILDISGFTSILDVKQTYSEAVASL